MAQEPSTESNPQNSQPDPALQRFDRLIGKWEMKARTLNATEDNIIGWNNFEWMLGGFFLKSEGEINFKGTVAQAIEIIAYDPETKTFPSKVYSSMSGDVLSYEWDVQGNTVIHKGLGATYTGTLSEDGNTLTGGWRPDAGVESNDGNTYDAVMTRVK
jgi:hypothetical protein